MENTDPGGLEQRTVSTILCCMCGTPIEANPSNMCINCLRHEVDITAEIPRQHTMTMCKGCGRWFDPPNHWVEAPGESRQMLSLCLKRLRGLSKLKLVDAVFLWSEPHSRRIRVKLTVQQQVLGGAILQQVFVVEYVVATHQCDACTKLQTPHQWVANVQVRQKVAHKRTLYFLEQLILKHNAHESAISVSEQAMGMDFFFAKRNAAIKFVDFLQTVLPVKTKASEKLISHDVHNNTATFKFTYSVEIAPLCKDDLVVLPKKTAQQLGGVPRLVLCTGVSNTFQFREPASLSAISLQGVQFWRNPFSSLLSSRSLTQFTVLGVELSGVGAGKYAIGDAVVARSSDFGVNDATFVVRTYLGTVLQPGDLVLGYDLTSANLNANVHDLIELPDVVLVRKTYARKNRGRRRIWKLKELDKDVAMDGEDTSGSRRRPRRKPREGTNPDMEAFKLELEEDPEMRGKINIYKDSAAIDHLQNSNSMQEDSSDDEVPQISLEELLDDMGDMTLGEEPSDLQ